MQNHDIVTIKIDLPNIPKGTKGTIVYTYAVWVYEVEFIINGKSILETLTSEDIEHDITSAEKDCDS